MSREILTPTPEKGIQKKPHLLQRGFSAMREITHKAGESVQNRLANVRTNLERVNSTGLTPSSVGTPRVRENDDLTGKTNDTKPGLLKMAFPWIYRRTRVAYTPHQGEIPGGVDLEGATKGFLDPVKKAIKDTAKWALTTWPGRAVLAASIAISGGAAVAPKILEHGNNTQGSATELAKKFPEVIPASSIRITTPEETAKIWNETKVIDDEKHTFVLGLPFDEETIKNNPEIRYRSYLDRASIIGIGKDLVDQLEQEGFKSVTVYSGLKKGDGAGLVYDETQFEASILEISRAGRGTEFIPAYSDVRIMLRSKVDGRTYDGNLSVLWGEPAMQINSAERKYFVYENGTPIKSGQRIYTLSTDLQDYDGQGQKTPFEEGQVSLGAIGGGIDPQTGKVRIFSTVSLIDSQGNKVVPGNEDINNLTLSDGR